MNTRVIRLSFYGTAAILGVWMSVQGYDPFDHFWSVTAFGVALSVVKVLAERATEGKRR